MGTLVVYHNEQECRMNLSEIFCPNIKCPAKGQTGRGNISVHSEKEKRCYCNVCKATFSVSKGTIFYRLKTDPVKVMLVITLLAYGCPLQAIVMAFGFDERTVKAWWQRAGKHCHQIHAHLVGQSKLDLVDIVIYLRFPNNYSKGFINCQWPNP